MRERSKSIVQPYEYQYLPDLAGYILQNRLKEYAATYYDILREVEYPLLKNIDLSKYSKEELSAMGESSARTFLQAALEKRLFDFQTGEIQKWVTNTLPMVERNKVVIDDITLLMYARKNVLCRYIPGFTHDLAIAMELVNEIDIFALDSETRLFSAYYEIQTEQVREISRNLEENQRRLIETQELAKLGSFEWNLTEPAKTEVSPYASTMLGLNEGRGFEKFIEGVHPGDRDRVRKAVEESMKSGDFECEYRWIRGGTEKVLWSRGIFLYDDGKPVKLRGTVMDITERHYMLRRLERNEELYKQSQQLAHIGNWTLTYETDELQWSDEMYRIHDMAPRESTLTREDVKKFTLEEDEKKVQETFSPVPRQEIIPDFVYRIKTEKGNIKVLRLMCRLIKDDQGKPVKLLGTCQDITREAQLTDELRKREENLEQLNATLQRRNIELKRSNDELFSFSYVASHDLQEPLRKIKTFCDMLVAKEGDRISGEGKALLDKVGNSVFRMQQLIQDLLSYSRVQGGAAEREAVDLHNIVQNIINHYNETPDERRPVFYADHLPVVEGVLFQLQQLFENIISNAVKYVSPGQKPHVKIHSELVEGKAVPDSLPGQNYIKISIADNGIGFEQQYAEKIFELFQRLHGRSDYSGTGIGLAICKRIVENHQGFIYAHGIPGTGSIFTVYLPAH